jgi:protein-S-isoprenylcysteine O-methyltransferase Ste14
MVLVPPPLLAVAAALAQRAVTGPRSRPTATRAAATAVVALASAALAGSASRQFRRLGTTFQPVHPERASVLVTTGSNAVSRNPMYAGLTGLLLAHAVWRGSWLALAPAAVFVGLIDRLQIEAEEAALAATFGADYEAYRATVPRWLDRRSLPLGRS